MSWPITESSTVTLHLSLILEDGTVAESTFHEEPFTFVMGDGSLDNGLELGLYGLTAGETQRLTLEPGQAFGPRVQENVHVMSRTAFDDEFELEEGMIVGFEAPDGEEVAGSIVEVGKDTVTVDFNHPLAGRRIIFDVEIIDVKPADAPE